MAYAINGDYDRKVKDDTRLREATNALSVLGVDKSHIFCLGYGDTLNNSPEGHIFYSDDEPVRSPHGAIETYGHPELEDFAYFFRKKHSPYTKNNYLRDLYDLVLYVHADIILAVDFDAHSDHRMLSLSFETVMGRILSRPDNDYRPEVFKGFAYAVGGWTAIKDFFADNLLETKKPPISKYLKEIIDTSCYEWEKRVRLPIPEGCRYPLLDGNLMAKAMRQHVSQNAIGNGERVINSDEVFFLRRTDSLTFQAQVRASSGNPDYTHDFKLVNVRDIDSEIPEWTDYLWQPEASDPDKQLVFSWKDEQKISRVVLWGNVDGLPLQRVLVRMDNGYSQELDALPEHGLPCVIDIPEESRQGVRELSISILDSGGTEGGLAEVEAFAELEQTRVLQPFLQITSGDNFVYCYNRKHGESRLPIGCYCYGTSKEVEYSVSGSGHLDGDTLVFDGDDDVVIRAEAGGLYCQAVFHTVSDEEVSRFRAIQSRERRKLRSKSFFFRQKNRILSYIRRLQEHGIMFTLKYALRKAGKKLSGIR